MGLDPYIKVEIANTEGIQGSSEFKKSSQVMLACEWPVAVHRTGEVVASGSSQYTAVPDQ